MKDVLRQILEPISDQSRKFCLAREYMQARVLQALQEQGAFEDWAFVGGTALRFIYSIARFSEDIDFSLIGKVEPGCFTKRIQGVQTFLAREAYGVQAAPREDKTVASVFLKFPGLLYEIGLSPHVSQVFSIKVEVDTRPPAGAAWEVSMVRRHVPLRLTHYDKASLLSGKMHAVLTRRYTKGRDLYDLIWYLADRSWPAPNIVQLRAALAQTGWAGPEVTEGSWRFVLTSALDRVDWDAARADVAPFLERPKEAELITQENVMSLLRP